MLDYRRRLPHWQPDEVRISIARRLWGSLPVAKRVGNDASLSTPGQAFAAADRALERDARGPFWLKDGRVAGFVAETIQIGIQERHWYEPYACAVMPNHVHLLVLPKVLLPVLTRWLKGSTARHANRLLRRTGQPFWQAESYDHWVCNQRELERIARYIEQNPVCAGLVRSAELWPWSSAGWQAEPPAPPRPVP
jgi:putative transposase